MSEKTVDRHGHSPRLIQHDGTNMPFARNPTTSKSHKQKKLITRAKEDTLNASTLFQ